MHHKPHQKTLPLLKVKSILNGAYDLILINNGGLAVYGCDNFIPLYHQETTAGFKPHHCQAMTTKNIMASKPCSCTSNSSMMTQVTSGTMQSQLLKAHEDMSAIISHHNPHPGTPLTSEVASLSSKGSPQAKKHQLEGCPKYHNLNCITSPNLEHQPNSG